MIADVMLIVLTFVLIGTISITRHYVAKGRIIFVPVDRVTEAMEYGEDDITDFDVDLTDADFRDISATGVLDKIVKRL